MKKIEPEGEFPATAYLLIGDEENPATWKLRFRDMNGTSKLQLDRLLALLGLSLIPGQFWLRETEFRIAIKKLRSKYTKLGLESPV